MFEPVLAIADGRVAQPPSLRKTFGVPPKAGKSTLSEKNARFVYLLLSMGTLLGLAQELSLDWVKKCPLKEVFLLFFIVFNSEVVEG
jgi:hypothetical protein